MRAAVVCGALSALALVLATLGPGAGEAEARDASSEGSSRSIAYPWNGFLEDGRRVEESDRIRLLDRHRERGWHYGADSMVALLERAAARVARRMPGARLTVGELSQPGGGNIPGHRSHENGLDADLGFYLRDEEGELASPPHFVPVSGRGHGWLEGERLTFDDAANWALVEALVTDERTPVQHVFVSDGLRRRLVRQARASGASPELVERVRWMLLQPGHGPRAHRDHFHVRIYCPLGERPQCRDRGPYWRWLPPPMTPDPSRFREVIADGRTAATVYDLMDREED